MMNHSFLNSSYGIFSFSKDQSEFTFQPRSTSPFRSRTSQNFLEVKVPHGFLIKISDDGNMVLLQTISANSEILSSVQLGRNPKFHFKSVLSFNDHYFVICNSSIFMITEREIKTLIFNLTLPDGRCVQPQLAFSRIQSNESPSEQLFGTPLLFPLVFAGESFYILNHFLCRFTESNSSATFEIVDEQLTIFSEISSSIRNCDIQLKR
jgi:hypothetical protein